MGLDQHVWADIEVNGTEKSVAIHYWRKACDIDLFFLTLLPESKQAKLRKTGRTVWTCQITNRELDLLEADEYALALKIGFDLELVWRCRRGLEEGFTLHYARDS